jgi:cob(I)alamin adenosyltransferase
MKKLTGRVVFRDIEMGVWVLEGDDGRTYQLAGGDRSIKKDGQRIEAEGRVDDKVHTIGMVGLVLDVKSYRVL